MLHASGHRTRIHRRLRAGRVCATVVTAVVLVIASTGSPGAAQTTTTDVVGGEGAETTTSTTTLPTTSTTAAPTTTATTAAPGTSTTAGSGTPTTTAAPDTTTPTPTSAPEVEDTTTTLAPRPATPPAVQTTSVPLSSVVLAVLVLLVVSGLVWMALRRGREEGDDEGRPETPPAIDEPVAPVPPPAVDGHTGDVGGGATRPGAAQLQSLHFLLELGKALIDAGDSVGSVEATLARVAEVNGIRGLGTVVLPTALIISVPQGPDVQTEVRTAGTSRLRMDQCDEVFRLVDAAERGALTPLDGLNAIARARTMPPRFSPPVRLLGATVFTVGLVMLLRGTWADLVLAAVLGVGIGALQLALQRSTRPGLQNFQAFWPLLAAFGVTVVVLSLGRVVDDLSVYPPLVASLVTFLPGGLLTIGVMELSSGHVISGGGRLASGFMQLVLLALGIVAGAQLVGVPASTIGETPDNPAVVLVAWLGVAVFGVGVFVFHNARPASLKWMLVVLYVAYAGQVLGGVFFGGTLSAFFGAVAMTPVAMLAARQKDGPAMLVSFLPGFWLLVPGALGLEGVTRILGDDELEGVNALATTVTTMVGVALGVLLGMAIGARIPALNRPAWVSRAVQRARRTGSDEPM